MNRILLFVPATVLLVLPALAQQARDPETVAEVDGEKITLPELTKASGQALASLEEQSYRLKRQKLDRLIQDRLFAQEAQRRNLSLQSLIETEITSKTPEVSTAETHRVYELNKTQLQKPEADVEGQIRSLLRNQKIELRRVEFAKSLESKSRVSVYLAAPAPFRAEVDEQGPSLGASDAPVTIVAFEDFQCPFCRKVNDTVQRVVDRYRDQVKLVHHDFPLQPLHPAAWKAHEAARCAADQGKFWQFRDLLYKNAPAASLEDLKGYASRLGLNMDNFSSCLGSGKFTAAVQRDEEEGERVGVQGTPAFFVNGRFLSGAQPESEFARLIDEELNKRTLR